MHKTSFSDLYPTLHAVGLFHCRHFGVWVVMSYHGFNFFNLITYEHTYMLTNHLDILIFKCLKAFGPLNGRDLPEHQN